MNDDRQQNGNAQERAELILPPWYEAQEADVSLVDNLCKIRELFFPAGIRLAQDVDGRPGQAARYGCRVFLVAAERMLLRGF